MTTHTLTAAGPVRTDDCVRLVVCDRYNQPLAVFLDVNGQTLTVMRGSKAFDDLVSVMSIGRSAVTAEVDLDLTGGR